MKTALLAVAALTFGLSACSAEREEIGFEDPANQPELAFVESEDGPAEADAFDFIAPELFTGQPVDGSDLFIDSPTIITFVDPNCPVCVSEGPKLAEAAAEHANVNFVVIHGYSGAEAYASYVDRSDLHVENMVHLVDNDGTLTNRFGLLFQPSSILVDGDGNMTVASGAMGVEGINEAVAIIDPDA